MPSRGYPIRGKPVRGKQPIPTKRKLIIGGAVAVAVIVLVLAVFRWGPTRVNQIPKITRETEVENRQKEIAVLEKAMQDAIDRARTRGKPQAELDQIRADYQSQIEKLKAENAKR